MLKNKKTRKSIIYELFESLCYDIRRDDWIRTSGLFVPNEARYRAALHPELGEGAQYKKDFSFHDNFYTG